LLLFGESAWQRPATCRPVIAKLLGVTRSAVSDGVESGGGEDRGGIDAVIVTCGVRVESSPNVTFSACGLA
jgi:hypothetical protein